MVKLRAISEECLLGIEKFFENPLNVADKLSNSCPPFQSVPSNMEPHLNGRHERGFRAANQQTDRALSVQ